MNRDICILSCLIAVTYTAYGSVDFQPLRQYEAGNHSTGLFAADFDEDGDVDVAVSNRDTHSVSILLNTGSGLFHGPFNYETGLVPRYVDGADFNEDGFIDLCTPDYVGNTTTVLLNDGFAEFSIALQEPIFTPSFLWVDDVDLDGHADILNLHWDENADPPSQAPAIFTPMYGNGDGTFQIGETEYIGSQPRCGATADLNMDGYLDVVTANYRDYTLSILMGQGDRSFSEELVIELPGSPRYLGLADLDANETIDIALVDKTRNQLVIIKNNGKGQFAIDDADYPTNDMPHSLSLGDVDQDGFLDVMVTHVGSSNQKLYFNNGKGIFEEQQILSMISGPAEVKLKDVSGDGFLDILAANVNNNAPGLSVLIQGSCAGPDCNGNGIPDDCDLPDCNVNGVPDSCDISFGFSSDIDQNGIPDECEPDCNGNAIPDAYEIYLGVATDCNGNGIPDDCDWNVANDCDGNGILDGCESDINHDLIPDACQCMADFDANLIVDVDDLLIFISHWGDEIGHDPVSIADLNGDLEVGVDDLLLFITMWGECPETAQTHPIGACCIQPEIGPSICVDNRAELGCYILNGVWIGAGTDCDTTDCENP